jgi:hypothetical protein
MSERPRVKRRREEDGIETGDSTCRLQRQDGVPKYISEAYISPNYQAMKYEAETTDSTASQPCYPSEDVHETRVQNISPETHTLTADATTIPCHESRPVPELTPVHKAYKLALSQEPVTSRPSLALMSASSIYSPPRPQLRHPPGSKSVTLLKGAEDTYPLLQSGHLQPPQGCVLRLLNPLKLGLEEVELELLVGMVVFELAIHADVTVETPIPIFTGRFLQGCVGHSGALKELQEPVGHGQDHVVVVAVIVGGRIDLLNPGDLVWPMLFGESRDATVGELFDPMSGLPHPILNGYGEARASSVTIEYVPFGAFFSGQGGTVVDESRPEELEFFPLGVTLPGPLFAVLSMLALPLLEGADETACEVSDCVHIVRHLDGGCGSMG